MTLQHNGATTLATPEPTTTDYKVLRVPLLKSGLSQWKGTISEEYLPQLKPWSRAYKVFTEMQDDVVIGAVLDALMVPLLSSPFVVTPANDSLDAKEVASFISHNLFDMMDQEWEEHVEDTLSFIPYGFNITEKILEKRPDGKLWLRALIPIGQDTLESWGPIDDFGRVTSFNQRVDGKKYCASMEKLIHIAYRPRKRNPMGWSILRSLYRPWYFKKNLETLEAIGIERDVGNAPVISLEAGVHYEQKDLDHVEKSLEAFRMDEALFIVLPAGMSLAAYGGGNKVYDVRQVIRDWQHLIRQRLFADFLSLGSEQVGTQALASEMTNFFGVGLRYYQRKMVSTWDRQLIRWLMFWNRIPIELKPNLQWLPPSEQSLQSLAQAYNTLVGAHVLNPDEAVQQRVRLQLGLPPVQVGTAPNSAPGTGEPTSGPLNKNNPGNQ